VGAIFNSVLYICYTRSHW